MGLKESESERDGRENGRDAGMLKVVVCSAAAQSGMGEVSTVRRVPHASDNGKCGLGDMHDGYRRLTGAVALCVRLRALGCKCDEDEGDDHNTHGQNSRWLDLQERTSTAESLYRMSWGASVCYIYGVRPSRGARADASRSMCICCPVFFANPEDIHHEAFCRLHSSVQAPHCQPGPQ